MKINELLTEKRRYNLPAIITPHEWAKLKMAVPIQKIIGFINFDNLIIKVNHDVLIPRYETEEVVVKALSYIQTGMKVLDLGCGSGYIGLTIKSKIDVEMTLSDIDPIAIVQTKENAALNNLTVTVVESNLFANITGQYDVIIANLPYIPANTSLASSVLNYEPHHALFGGWDGNDYYRKFLDQVFKYLRPKGYLIFEISPANSDFLRQKGFTIFKDINNKERIAVKRFTT